MEESERDVARRRTRSCFCTPELIIVALKNGDCTSQALSSALLNTRATIFGLTRGSFLLITKL